jgi:hypothetical protein
MPREGVVAPAEGQRGSARRTQPARKAISHLTVRPRQVDPCANRPSHTNRPKVKSEPHRVVRTRCERQSSRECLRVQALSAQARKVLKVRDKNVERPRLSRSRKV